MTEATNIPTGATPLDVMIGALENEIAALRKQNDALVAALEFISSAIHSDEWDEMGALLEAIDKSATAALEAAK